MTLCRRYVLRLWSTARVSAALSHQHLNLSHACATYDSAMVSHIASVLLWRVHVQTTQSRIGCLRKVHAGLCQLKKKSAALLCSHPAGLVHELSYAHTEEFTAWHLGAVGHLLRGDLCFCRKARAACHLSWQRSGWTARWALAPTPLCWRCLAAPPCCDTCCPSARRLAVKAQLQQNQQLKYRCCRQSGLLTQGINCTS